jgi:uncharacterized sporulation protein YeaH/YhbH (DUF444 family)
MDSLMKRLEDKALEKKEVRQLFKSRMTCEEFGNTGHSSALSWRRTRTTSTTTTNIVPNRINDGLNRGPTTQVTIQVIIKVIIIPIISHI